MLLTDKYKELRKTLKKVLDRDRYVHTVGVAYTAAALAMRYGEDLERAYLAGLLHDCAKCLPKEDRLPLCKAWKIPVKEIEKKNTTLLHAKMGAYLAKNKYGVKDQEILSAIACHTVGKPDMTLLEKIIFTADYIELNRDQAKDLPIIRKTAFENLDLAVYLMTKGTLDYLNTSSDKEIDTDALEVFAFYKQKVEEQGLI